MVLADALLLPEDDLALATVLKSPLFGFDDDDLFKLAWRRKGPLRAVLSRHDDARFAAVADMLDRLTETARRQTPFAFFARVLGPERGRKKFLARLGHEANDALDEFLNLALDYERRETPSLQGFLAWVRAAQTDIKRDMEITRDEVRVMTVHGAKGLEAPIVILADTTTPPAGPAQHQPKLLTIPADDAPGAPERFVWAVAKREDVAPVGVARERARREAEHEYRRLLYVAMTRAINRLVVCGVDGKQKRPEGCWYDLVSNALKPLCTQNTDEDGAAVWRYCKTLAAEMAAPAASPPPAQSQDKLPSWLTCNVAPAPSPVIPLSPSAAYDESVPVRTAGSGVDRALALVRGEAMHRLLQSLPDIPPAARREAARRYLDRAAYPFTAAQRDEMVSQTFRLLDDPRFAAVFAAGGRAEAPIVGRLKLGGGMIAVAGRVDRLAVTAEAVLIVDYKTNRPAPGRVADVPKAYLAQLALYRAVLAELYPGKAIHAALLWTEVPDLMELSDAVLKQALSGVTPP
jgi:ATP-dependent helicase/nuclease subunit A